MSMFVKKQMPGAETKGQAQRTADAVFNFMVSSERAIPSSGGVMAAIDMLPAARPRSAETAPYYSFC